MATTIILEGGPLDGQVRQIHPPWPRASFMLDYGTEGMLAVYHVTREDSPAEATFYRVVSAAD